MLDMQADHLIRLLATVKSVDVELKARQGLSADKVRSFQAGPTDSLLEAERAAALAKEMNASLEVMRIQSHIVDAEVVCQRMLQHISSLPSGFER